MCDFERIKGILREHTYDVRVLLDERMLYNFRLMPFIPDQPVITCIPTPFWPLLYWAF